MIRNQHHGSPSIIATISSANHRGMADHERDLAGEVDRIGPVAVLRRGVNPVAAFLQRLDRARKVRHLRDLHPLRRAGGRFHRHRREADAVVLRDDDEIDAESVRDAQDGPEVLRIGDASRG